jgi:pimeloyl-ACP methyl ester carboxylesterase
MKPTIVLVHGAYAEASSWNDVIPPLLDEGHRVIAFAAPLRGVASDAAQLTDLVRSIEGPVVLVGHSFGGALLTNVPADAGQITGLVFLAGFALEPGEGCGDASGLVRAARSPRRSSAWRSPAAAPTPTSPRTSTAASSPRTCPRCRRESWRSPSVPSPKRRCSSRRPPTRRCGRSVPSWFLWGDQDHNIPAGAHRIMAERAGARRTQEIAGASHVVGMSHPAELVEMVLEAAGADVTAKG